MKKRSTKIILITLAASLLIFLDIFVIGNELTPTDRKLMVVGGILLFVSLIVAKNDEMTRRNRHEVPVDYMTVEGFRVKERYCTMGVENLAILTLYNPSKRTTTVTVRVTFFNVAGKVLGTETQTIHGMVRGMGKHLCFRPGRDFHTFTYTLEASSYRGICHERAYRAEYFRVTTPLSPASPHKGICPMEMEIFEEYTGTAAVEVVSSYLLLDKENTVRGLCHASPRILHTPFDSRTVTAAAFEIVTEGNIPLGEELGGIGLTGLCIYSVTPIQ